MSMQVCLHAGVCVYMHVCTYACMYECICMPALYARVVRFRAGAAILWLRALPSEKAGEVGNWGCLPCMAPTYVLLLCYYFATTFPRIWQFLCVVVSPSLLQKPSSHTS